jgi:signal transduction histidine kinase
MELVEDALSMNAAALARRNVKVVRDYPAEAIECQVERHKVLQILVNLIRNAEHACDESGRPDKQLIVKVKVGSGRAQIAVKDNGVGIPAENLTRIFNHGFTTREHGHGFGLHSGALAAKELGGSLAAYSDGPETGATFVLNLPLQDFRCPAPRSDAAPAAVKPPSAF